MRHPSHQAQVAEFESLDGGLAGESQMSKRVYEIARELNLSTKEVIERLNAAGMEVKSHFAVVQDPLVERVFGEGSEGEGSDGTASNGRSQAQDVETSPAIIPSPPEASRSGIEWLRKRSLPIRVYVAAAMLAFAVAAGVGATTALMVRGDLSLPASKEPRASGQQGNTPQRQGAVADRSQQKEAGEQPSASRPQEQKPAAQPAEKAASQQDEAEYVSKVGDIQSESVETFLDSHQKFMPYDALTADDIEEMQVDQATLKGFADQVDGLDPPQKHREQYEVFRSAINELYEATKLAYELAADPTAASQSGFAEYDRHVSQAAAYLKKSNEMLGRDYKTIEGVRRVSALS
jgi:Translation initiation factor IF-2, N-terminal region